MSSDNLDGSIILSAASGEGAGGLNASTLAGLAERLYNSCRPEEAYRLARQVRLLALCRPSSPV
jgi:hypothetical protein